MDRRESEAFDALNMALKKRRRRSYDEEDDIDSQAEEDDEESYVPQQKRPRRIATKNVKAKDSDEDYEDYERSQLKAKCTKLEKENLALTRENHALKKAMKKLKAKGAPAAGGDDKIHFSHFKNAFIRTASYQNNYEGTEDIDIEVEQTVDFAVFSALFANKGGQSARYTPDEHVDSLCATYPDGGKTIRFADWNSVHSLFSDCGVNLLQDIEVGAQCFGGEFPYKIGALNVTHIKPSALFLIFHVSRTYM